MLDFFFFFLKGAFAHFLLKVWVSLIPEVNQTVIEALAFRQAILDLVKNENFNNVIVEREMLYR